MDSFVVLEKNAGKALFEEMKRKNFHLDKTCNYFAFFSSCDLGTGSVSQ